MDISLCILTLTIDDCLGCRQVEVRFSKTDRVHLLLYSADRAKATRNDEDVSSWAITPVARALQLLCSQEYVSAESLQRMPQLQVGKGCVKMSFSLRRMCGITDPNPDSDLDMEPSTSQQAHQREQLRRQQRMHREMTYNVTVVRRFDDVHVLERVRWQVDGGEWRETAITEFHSIFFVQELHKTSDLLRTVQDTFVANNWLNVIQADGAGFRSFLDNGNPFETFAKLFERQNSEDRQLLQRLTSDCLLVSETTRLCERRCVLHIFEQVRTIFENITAKEYTVWFFVPRLNNYTTLEHVHVADFDLRNVRTKITITTDSSELQWSDADHNIMDILKVAFQLCLARVAKQTVVFLGKLEKLDDFLSMQYIKASYMNSIYSSTDGTTPTWIYPRYLHRIIEVAESLGLIVFIEYPSGSSALPDNRQVVRCLQEQEGEWIIYHDITKTAPFNVGFELLKELVSLK